MFPRCTLPPPHPTPIPSLPPLFKVSRTSFTPPNPCPPPSPPSHLTFLIGWAIFWRGSLLYIKFSPSPLQGLSGGTTVSGTMIAAHNAGIPIFATGGIGGVHRGVEESKYFVLAWPFVCFSAFHGPCGCGALHSPSLSVCLCIFLFIYCCVFVCIYNNNK